MHQRFPSFFKKNLSNCNIPKNAPLLLPHCKNCYASELLYRIKNDLKI